MTTVLALIAVVAVLFVAAVVATREGPILVDAPPDAADLGLPDEALTAADVRGLRFALAPRGYRMSEVDEALDRVAAELAERDRRIAELESAAGGEHVVVRGVPHDDQPADAHAGDPALAADPVADDTRPMTDPEAAPAVQPTRERRA